MRTRSWRITSSSQSSPAAEARSMPSSSSTLAAFWSPAAKAVQARPRRTSSSCIAAGWGPMASSSTMVSAAPSRSSSRAWQKVRGPQDRVQASLLVLGRETPDRAQHLLRALHLPQLVEHVGQHQGGVEAGGEGEGPLSQAQGDAEVVCERGLLGGLGEPIGLVVVVGLEAPHGDAKHVAAPTRGQRSISSLSMASAGVGEHRPPGASETSSRSPWNVPTKTVGIEFRRCSSEGGGRTVSPHEEGP